jgi:hypothetical protein
MRNCFITESGVIKDGEVNMKAAENLFFDQSRSHERPLKDEWKKIVTESVEHCNESFPIKTGIRDDDYVYFYTKFIECVRLFNFVNCHDFKSDGNCTLIKDVMAKNCNASDYEFLHEVFYEGSYYRTHDDD